MKPVSAACRMIEFSCRCHHHFSLPEDQAGGMIQCPSCHRLVDVPNLSDLHHIDEDGNYKFDDDELIPLAEPDRLPTLHRAFTRQHTDDEGQEIDLRPTMEDVMEAGSTEIPLALSGEALPGAPKYDPFTGELIRPLEIKGNDERVDVAAVPMAQRAIEYAAQDLQQPGGLLRIGARLLQPVNLFVMSFMLLALLLLQPVNIMMHAGVFLVVPLWIIGIILILAHYGIIVDETGPCERDELPRPLREAALGDDIWHPFAHVAGGAILCALPIFVAGYFYAPAFVIVGLLLLGTFFYPAVLLTLRTSGSSANLRPDRILGVISACGGRYFLIVGLLIAGLALHGIGLWRFHLDSLGMLVKASIARGALADAPWWFQWWSAYPALLMGMHLLHWFAWSLGLMYRAHHDEFPWTLQRHIPTKLRDRTQLPTAAARTATHNSASVKQKLM